MVYQFKDDMGRGTLSTHPGRGRAPHERINMNRTAIIELEDGRIIKGSVLCAINHGVPGWEVELRLPSGDTFLWKQGGDGGRLLRIDA